MINKIFCDAIKSLNIPVFFTKKESGLENEFVIYTFYNIENDNYADNTNHTKVYYIQVDYFFKDILTMSDRIKELERLLEKSNFIFQGSNVIFENESKYYRCLSNYVYNERLEKEVL